MAYAVRYCSWRLALLGTGNGGVDARHGRCAGVGKLGPLLRKPNTPAREARRAQDQRRQSAGARHGRAPSLASPFFFCLFAYHLRPSASLSLLRGCSYDCHHITRLRLVMMDAGSLQPGLGASDFSSGGTGARLERAIIIVAGVCALVASLVTFV